MFVCVCYVIIKLFNFLHFFYLGPRFGIRHLQCFLAFCGLAVAYSLRVNLSVAIVAMTDKNHTNPAFDVSSHSKTITFVAFIIWHYANAFNIILLCGGCANWYIY